MPRKIPYHSSPKTPAPLPVRKLNPPLRSGEKATEKVGDGYGDSSTKPASSKRSGPPSPSRYR